MLYYRKCNFMSVCIIQVYSMLALGSSFSLDSKFCHCRRSRRWRLGRPTAETMKKSPSEQSIEAQLERDGSVGDNRGDLEMATIMEAAELEGSGSGSRW